MYLKTSSGFHFIQLVPRVAISAVSNEEVLLLKQIFRSCVREKKKDAWFRNTNMIRCVCVWGGIVHKISKTINPFDAHFFFVSERGNAT